MSARQLLLLAMLLMAAPLATAVDGTYAIDEFYQGRICHLRWIFAHDHMTYPDAAACTVVPSTDGVDISWNVVGTPKAVDTAIMMCLMHGLGLIPGHAPGAAKADDTARSSPAATSYHAHLAPDGSLSGSGSSVSGSSRAEHWTFAGRREGPPRESRQPLTWTYRTGGDASALTWSTDAVEIQVVGIDGAGFSSGSFMVDGEGCTSGDSGAVVCAYADGVATLRFVRRVGTVSFVGDVPVTFTDHGRTMSIGSQRFDLAGGRPTVRINADGSAIIVHRDARPLPGALDGRSFALIVHAGAQSSADTVVFEGGRCRLLDCTMLGPPQRYAVTRAGDPTGFNVDAEISPMGIPLTYQLTATIEHGAIAGSASISNFSGRLFAFDFTGTEIPK